MGLFSDVCPECGAKNPGLAENCHNCGARLGVPMGAKTTAADEAEGQSLEGAAGGNSSLGYSVVMGVFVAISLILLAIGFFSSDISAVQQTALFAASAVFAIFARIAQAGAHQVKTESLLRRVR